MLTIPVMCGSWVMKTASCLVNCKQHCSRSWRRGKISWDRRMETDLSSLSSEAFVRFFVELVGHYPLHMVESSNGSRELQRDSFRKSHPSRGVRQFLQLFMDTQMFAGFIQEKELRKGGGRGLFEVRVTDYLGSYPEPEPSGVNKFLKGLGHKMKLLQMK